MHLRFGRYAAYAALGLSLLGLPLIAASDAECRFVGSPTQDYAGSLDEPGRTGGVLAFTVAPLLAIAALVPLARALRRGTGAIRLAFGAAVLTLPIAVANLLMYFAAGAFACGLGN